jgi:FtsH-binding integral membrane protein
VYSRVELVNSIVAVTVNRLPSKKPLPEMFKASPWFGYMLTISSMIMGFWISKSLHKKSK